MIAKLSRISYMDKFIGFFGIVVILIVCYFLSNNKKIINYKLVITGLLIQALFGFFILKVPFGKTIFEFIAKIVTAILSISQEGTKFVFGALASEKSFIFAIQIPPTIIFVCALVSVLYYFGILQVINKYFALVFNKLLNVSGAEALANCIVPFVGQVQSAIVIQPYLSKLTKSEILTIMTGGMACISGAFIAVYSSFGIKIEYLLAGSFMSIPGSFVISKIVYPEDNKPLTKDTVNIEYEAREKNLIESILDGAYSGAKISVGVIAMLLAFISLVALIDRMFLCINPSLSLKTILGYLFTPLIYLLGVPREDINTVSSLFGTKIALNEFIAYLDMVKVTLSLKGNAISTVLLCGFANFSSIAIQVGGLSQMAPERKSDFAECGFKAMIAGALVSCVSGAIVGMLV